MSTKIIILGAGFGGLELSSLLSDALPGSVEITLIDKNDGFVFGFSKFDLMLGTAELPDVTFSYRDIKKPAVEFRQETVTRIDPGNKRVVTDAGEYEADVLVVALGADYDIDATPGLREGGHEFYSVPGAQALRDVLSEFRSGRLVIGIIGQPFKCPPAPFEAAILLDEFYRERGTRRDIEISVVSQWAVPIPPSPEGSAKIARTLEAKGIGFVRERVITALDTARGLAVLRDGGSIPYDLFLGVPVHRVPEVVSESGLAEDGWIPVDERNLSTEFPGVYAIGDVTSAPVPKAGVFAESAAQAVASHLVARLSGDGAAEPFSGLGNCYVEFGDGTVGRLDANFFPGSQPTAPFAGPSLELAREKAEFVTQRRARWLG